MKEKQALLAVSFGTTFHDTLEKNIVAIERDLAAAFPGRDVFRAFTSGMVLRRLRERDGIEIDNVSQALERLQSWGADCVGLGQRLAMADPAQGEKLLEQWPEVFSSLPVQASVETSLTRLLFLESS